MALGIKEKSTCTFTIIAIKKELGNLSETIHNFSQLLGSNSDTSRETLGHLGNHSQLLTTSRKQFGNLSENTRRISETIRTSIRQARSAVRSCRHVYGVASRYMYTVCCVMRSNIYGQVYTLKTCFVFSRVVLVFLKQKTKKLKAFLVLALKPKKLEENQKNKKNSRKPKNKKQAKF